MIDGRMSSLTDHLSEWSRHHLQNPQLPLPRVCMQGFIGRSSLNLPQRMLTLAIRTKILLVVDKALQMHRKESQYVFFLVIMCHVMMTYFLLGRTSERWISSLRRGGPSHGARPFLTHDVCCETHRSHQRESGKATLEANVRLSITFPGWMCCSSGTGDGTH